MEHSLPALGLWVLSETTRTWARHGEPVALGRLLAEASDVPPLRSGADVDASAFLPPGDMPIRIKDACRKSGQPVPESKPEVVRCILESLALAHRRSIRDAARLSGREVQVVHVVGGGVMNELLCQLTADACGLPVLAGPVDATALGNVLVQARALGAGFSDLPAIRDLIRRTHQVHRYEPRTATSVWDRAEQQLSAAVPG